MSCNVTNSFEIKNVCLDEQELNGVFVHVCHSLSMLCYFCPLLFWKPSVPCQGWISDYMLPFVSVQLFWHNNGSLQNNLRLPQFWSFRDLLTDCRWSENTRKYGLLRNPQLLSGFEQFVLNYFDVIANPKTILEKLKREDEPAAAWLIKLYNTILHLSVHKKIKQPVRESEMNYINSINRYWEYTCLAVKFHLCSRIGKEQQ